MNIYTIITTILWVVFGFIVAYLKTRSDIIDAAKEKITEAEEMYQSTAKAGGEKFKWVCDFIYGMIPAPMQLIFTKELIGSIVQNVFDSMAKYATTQLDKVFKK